MSLSQHARQNAIPVDDMLIDHCAECTSSHTQNVQLAMFTNAHRKESSMHAPAAIYRGLVTEEYEGAYIIPSSPSLSEGGDRGLRLLGGNLARPGSSLAVTGLARLPPMSLRPLFW